MPKQAKFLSREELITQWHDIARAFDADLNLPVDNGYSLVLTFSFKHESGETQVMIKDLASTGSSLVGDSSTFESSVTTTFEKPIDIGFRMTLPPIFPWFFKKFYKNVTSFYLGQTKYWINSKDQELRNNIALNQTTAGLHKFRFVFMEAKNNEFSIKTSDFLGKRDQIEDLITLHLNVIKLLNK